MARSIAPVTGKIGENRGGLLRIITASGGSKQAFSFLVPKLHLGTYLSKKLSFVFLLLQTESDTAIRNVPTSPLPQSDRQACPSRLPGSAPRAHHNHSSAEPDSPPIPIIDTYHLLGYYTFRLSFVGSYAPQSRNPQRRERGPK